MAIDRSTGVYYLGIIFNTFLYGLVLGQFFDLFQLKIQRSSLDPKDRAIVYSLLFLDTIHSIVEIYAVWQTGVINYGNLGIWASVSWTIPFTAVATSVAAIITQIFLAFRVYSFTQSKILLGIICLASTLGLVFGCIAGVMSGIIQQVANFGPLVPFVVLWLAFQSLSDFIITASLVIALVRSRTGFRKTDRVISRLIQGAIETGTITSLFALGDLFSFVFFRNTNLYAMFAFPIGRIYTNTLLHTLNAREELRNLTGSIVDCDSESNAGAIRRLQEQSRMVPSGEVEMVRVPGDRAHSSSTGDLSVRLETVVEFRDEPAKEQKHGISFAFV
ncbi:hypothetical protein MVEN_00789000 [Mycena venus]|uniref:DUF6534 domain-containing protein n=1 Tax=Mycena venus TaxID=2733690 RepID=A0A8H6YL36_9AGAR|nr:hypothetical protein MVEN_00789000 [Mycena venus]